MLLLTGMILLATTQILMRNLWDTGLAWADPSLRIAVLWVALLGALAATRDDNHIGKAGILVYAEHDPGAPFVRPHHALNAHAQGDIHMVEPHFLPVADRPV